MNICEEINELPSCPNDLKILLQQTKKEVKELAKSTNATLLIHDGKIAELTKYIKENLSNSIRCLLANMEDSRRIRQIN